MSPNHREVLQRRGLGARLGQSASAAQLKGGGPHLGARRSVDGHGQHGRAGAALEYSALPSARYGGSQLAHGGSHAALPRPMSGGTGTVERQL